MFNNVALDVVIGLIFIFLLYSLFATIILELIAQGARFRAYDLRDGIRRMMDEEEKKKKDEENAATPSFTSAFYKHPLLKSLAKNSGCPYPSYITPDNFSQTVIHLLRSANFDNTIPQMELIRNTLFPTRSSSANISLEELKNLHNSISMALQADEEKPVFYKLFDLFRPKKMKETNGPLKNHITALGSKVKEIITLQANSTSTISTHQFVIKDEPLNYLRTLWTDSSGDIEKFKSKLESWFNDAMDRASGWYKRKMQKWLFIIGFILAAAFNVDSIAIVRILSHDKNAREELANMAAARYKYYDPNLQNKPDSFLLNVAQDIRKDAEAAQSIIGIGWFNKLDSNEINAIKLHITNADSSYKKRTKSIIDAIIVDTSKREKYLDSLNLIRDSTAKVSDSLHRRLSATSANTHQLYQFPGYLVPFGWLITAIAISLGAPFWFDLLNKIVRLRGSGPKPDAEVSTTTKPNSSAAVDPSKRKG